MGLRDFFSRFRTNSDDEMVGSGANPSTIPVTSSRVTPLAAVCEANDFDGAMDLLQGGADPNDVSRDGRTPLFYCNEVALVSLLVHFGADVNATDNEGNTPIMKYLRGENFNSNGERAIIVLIEAGADLDVRNNEGLNARNIASRAVSYGGEELPAAFEQGLRVVDNRKRIFDAKASQQRARREAWHREMNPIADSNPRNVIPNCFLACNMNDIEVLRAHEDVVRRSIRSTMGGGGMNVQTMLMTACADSSVEVVEYLLSLGSDINQLDDTGQAPLRYAAVSWLDAERKIELLLDAGADVNHRCYDESAALSDAAYRQNTAAAKALIAHGADVNNRDSQGFSALSWTCGQGVPEADIVELLLRHGADVNDLYERGCALQYIDYGNSQKYQ